MRDNRERARQREHNDALEGRKPEGQLVSSLEEVRADPMEEARALLDEQVSALTWI